MVDKGRELSVLKRVVTTLVETVRKQDFLTYFRKLSIVSIGEGDSTIVFGVVSGFVRDNLTHRFSGEILAAARVALPEIQSFDVIVDTSIDAGMNAAVIDCTEEYKHFTSKKVRAAEVPEEDVIDGINARSMNDRYRLENFIVGPSNQLAYAACDAVSRRPGSAYNPVYIYGGVGLGKTHLLQATGNAIKGKHKGKKIIYTTADRFLNDYTSHVKKKTVDRMREKYRSIDVLIVDDVQFLAGKTQTQVELYNIFNLLYEENKQIILSGDRPPKELTELEPRLQSRFEWGITVDVSAPDFETRLAIIQEKSREREFLMPQNVSEYIAYNTGENVREIEGVLNQIIAEYELHNTPPTIENVSARLSKLSITDPSVSIPKKKFAIRSYEDLLEAVSGHFGIEKTTMLGDDRRKQNMIPRQVAMYLLKNKLNYTYERIGNIFSGRNHSAVLYSCRKLEAELKKDQQLVYEVNVIRDKLGL